MSTNAGPPLELWGGLEATVNRVRDRFHSQMARNGHWRREDDLDRFAALGIKALRYPVLWELLAPDQPGQLDFSWTDRRLHRLRELGVRPIAGLVHHGSGPAYTSLLDPRFPALLADYAGAVAERYPWLDAYTPVNEPFTTARFSTLYELWYPHGYRDEAALVRAMLNQMRGTILAMQAIRRVNPAAQLVQTDDLGRTYGPPEVAGHAAFCNERRFLTFDLLCGRINPQHPVWRWLRRNGATEAELAWFEANATPPDVIGVNHYLTSDRYLLTGVANCPPEWHWHDAERTYVDVEAIRVDEQYPIDMATALSDAWERYRLPVAVTEAHLGCTRDEQVRWLHESWQGAQRLRAAGADVRAVTAWSLLGSYDWNSLVTRDDGFYEPGVFDVRAPEPRPTALAKLMRQLASGQQADHPVLDVPGWWHRPHRTWDAQAAGRTICFNRGLSSDWHEVTGGRPLLITGATGTLGRAFARICDTRGLPHHLLGREELDLASGQPFGGVLGSIRPWAVINAAGYVRVDDAETAEEHCRAANVAGPAQLAAACAERGIRLVTFSSDLVFDGRQRHPYSESSPIAPLNAYGRSKAEMERRVLAALPDALVVRTSAFFGPWDEYNFVTQALRALSRHEQFLAADDCTISPTYVPDLVNASLDLLIDGESGLWHLANQGAVTWADLARLAARAADVPTSSLVTRPMAALGLPAPRPLYSVLASERGWIMPPLEDALRRCLHWLDLPVRDESLAA